jgi:WD40 repeat protein
VALYTFGSEGHKIGLHDVRLKCLKQNSSVTLEGPQEDPVVEHMKFDPYGNYLAVGRADNFVQIFDVRTNKFIHEFHHANSIAGPGIATFGITGLCWITGWQGIGLRLFTGGDDGENYTDLFN